MDGLEEVTGNLQPSIGAVVRLGSESHGSSVAATSAGLLVVGTASVPCQSNEDLNESQQTLKNLAMSGNSLQVRSCHHRSHPSQPKDEQSRCKPSGNLPG